MSTDSRIITRRMEHIANVALLKSLRLLDTETEECFDEVVNVAAALFDVPTVLISLLDLDRQWFKAKVGMAAEETALSVSFCRHAVETPDVLVVPDATRDDRFKDNPLVTAENGIRFYAGAPLAVGPRKMRIGTLCLIDPEPRPRFPTADRNLLRGLAIIVAELIEGRAAKAEAMGAVAAE